MITTTANKLMKIFLLTLGVTLFATQQQTHGLPNEIPNSFTDWFKNRSWSGSATVLAATIPLANDWKFLMKMFNNPCPTQNLCTWGNVATKGIMTLIKTTPYLGALLGASGLYYWLFAKGNQASKSIGKNILLSALTSFILYCNYK